MKLSNIKNYSLALASVLSLGIIGCGTTSPVGEKSAAPNNPVAPPANNTATVTHPTVNYKFFEIGENTTDVDLKNDRYINYGYMIAKTTPGFDTMKFSKLGMEVVNSFTVGGAEYYHLEKKDNMLLALKSAKRISGLIYIEPEIMHYVEDETYTPWNGKLTNPSPALSQTYGLRNTATIEAWEKHGFGPHKAVVANIDSGINYNHENFKNITRHAFTWYGDDGTTPLPGISNPANDPQPADWLVTKPVQTNGTDGNGHGSHTAGTSVAEGNIGVGAAGICWGVDLISYKGATNAGSGGAFPVYGGIWHLGKWKKEANYPYTIPVNISMGSNWAGEFAVDMVEYGLANNIVVIASAGNSSSGASSYPGSYNGVIRVGASNVLDQRAYFSSYGHNLSVVAPGNNIISVSNSGTTGTANMSGTSMASPQVAGLVGYMLTFAPNLRPDQIKTYIENNADFVGGATGYTGEYGWGRMNTLKTIDAVRADVAAGRQPASNYLPTPVKVKVVTRSDERTGALNLANVYLYQCNPNNGSIQTYVASSITSGSFAAMDLTDEESEPEDGVCYFNMLRPGFYRAVTSMSGFDLDSNGWISMGTQSQMFEVKQGVPVALEMELSAEFMHIQTFPTMDMVTGTNVLPSPYGRLPCDTMITIYRPDGTVAGFYDNDDFDTFSFLKPKTPGTYTFSIEPYIHNWENLLLGIIYQNTDWYELGGEYAVSVTSALHSGRAPLTYSTAGEMQGSQSQVFGTAQPILLDGVYYGYRPSRAVIRTTGAANRYNNPYTRIRDYYSFTIE